MKPRLRGNWKIGNNRYEKVGQEFDLETSGLQRLRQIGMSKHKSIPEILDPI